jgi:hypothetical protein
MDSLSRIDLDEFVIEKNIFNKQLFLNLRRMVLHAAPNMDEVVKWNMPVYEFEGKKICSITIHSDHSNLEFFIGARLRDPAHDLDGTG